MADSRDASWIAEVEGLGKETYHVARERGATAVARQLLESSAAVGSRTTIALVGERGRGKSSLLNALACRPGLLPVKVEVTTNVFTEVLLTAGGQLNAGVMEQDGQVRQVDIADLGMYVSEQGNPDNMRGVAGLRVRCPLPAGAPDEMRRALSGCVFIDTPGVGGLKAEHADRAFEAVRRSQALVFALEAYRPISEPELKFVRRVAREGMPTVFALTMADLHREHGEDLHDAAGDVRKVLGHEAEETARAPVVPVSALEWAIALRTEDDDQRQRFAERSGIPRIANVIGSHVVHPMRLSLAGRFLGEVEHALRYLAQADASALEAIEKGDGSERLAQAKRALAALPATPAGLINTELKRMHEELSETLRKGLREHYRSLTAEVETRWSGGLRSELPGRWNAGVEALWSRTITDLEWSAANFMDRVIVGHQLGAPTRGAFKLTRGLGEGSAVVKRTEGPREERVARVGGLSNWIAIAGYASSVVGIPTAIRLFSGRRQQIKRADMQQAKSWLAESRELAQDLFPELRRAERRVAQQLLEVLAARIAARRAMLQETVGSLAHLERARLQTARRRLAALRPLAERARRLAAANPLLRGHAEAAAEHGPGHSAPM